MKYNEKIYYQSVTDPFEIQEMSNGEKIELHYLNEEPFCNQFINQRLFSTWSCTGSDTYKLFIEKGMYEETQEFYTKEVNEIWIDFWDKATKNRKMYFLAFILPMLAILAVSFFLLAYFKCPTWSLIVLIVVAFIASLFGSAFDRRKLLKENMNAANKIREIVGLENFEAIVEKQSKYMEKYYDDLQKKYEEEDRLAEEALKQNEESVDALESDDNNDSLENNDSNLEDNEK